MERIPSPKNGASIRPWNEKALGNMRRTFVRRRILPIRRISFANIRQICSYPCGVLQIYHRPEKVPSYLLAAGEARRVQRRPVTPSVGHAVGRCVRRKCMPGTAVPAYHVYIFHILYLFSSECGVSSVHAVQKRKTLSRVQRFNI